MMLMKGGEGYRDEGVHGEKEKEKKKASKLRRVLEHQISVA